MVAPAGKRTVLLGCLAAAAWSAGGAAAPAERECVAPGALIVTAVHSARGAVRSIGVLDTRLHLYVYVPPATPRFVLGIYDQPDDINGTRPSSFVLFAPDGSQVLTLDRPAAHGWADYPVETGGRWGVWRLTVTGPEDGSGEEGAATGRARNLFRVRALGNVDLYLKPEPVARVRGLRLAAGEHRFTLQLPGGSSFRLNLFHPREMDAGAVRLLAPAGVSAYENRIPLLHDNRLRKDTAFTAVDVRGAELRGLWTLAVNLPPGKGEYGFGTDGEFRVFFTQRPLMPLPAPTPISTGNAAARVEVTSPQTSNETYVTCTDAHGHGMLSLLPGVAYRLHVTRGPEFSPAEATAEAGQAGLSAAPARRLARMPGWYAGDTHLHSTYYDGTHTPRQMVEAAQAAGLDWVIPTEHVHGPNPERAEQVIAETRDMSIPERFVVVPGMEYTSGTYHANVLGGVVSAPASAALPDLLQAVRAAETKARPLTLALNHPTIGKTAADLGRATEGLPLLELWNSPDPAATHLWWELLNRGRHLLAETGSDSHNLVHAEPGYRRTYAYLGDAPLTAPNLVRALRDGHSFLSRGALLDARFNGACPGATLPAGSLRLEAAAESAAPLDRLEIIHNGELLRRIELHGESRARCSQSLSGQAGWYLVQLYARGDSLPVALTNPVFMALSVQKEKP